METKDSYSKKMKEMFDDLNYKWKVERNKLEAKAQHAKVEVKKKFEDQLKTLQEKREKMGQKLDQVDNASEEAWKDLFEFKKRVSRSVLGPVRTVGILIQCGGRGGWGVQI